MKQFATGTAVLKTPRPITFELAFLAAVAAAAACETSHTYVSPWDGGSGRAYTVCGSFALEAGQCWARENPGVWGLVTYLGCLGGRLVSAVLCQTVQLIGANRSFWRSLRPIGTWDKDTW